MGSNTIVRATPLSSASRSYGKGAPSSLSRSHMPPSWRTDVPLQKASGVDDDEEVEQAPITKGKVVIINQGNSFLTPVPQMAAFACNIFTRFWSSSAVANRAEISRAAGKIEIR